MIITLGMTKTGEDTKALVYLLIISTNKELEALILDPSLSNTLNNAILIILGHAYTLKLPYN